LRSDVSADLVERLDQASTVVVSGDEAPRSRQNLGEIRATEIRHAQYTQTACRIVTDRVHRYDVGVLQPREDLRLVAVRTRHFDGDKPAPQIDLLGKVDVRERTTTQLGQDAKSRQFLAGLRKAGRRAPRSRIRQVASS
jgi:hypothetical protein